MNNNITIIGAGNMGACLLGGLIANQYSPEKITISDPSAERLAQLKNQFHVQTTHNNNEAIQHADVIILAVKPSIMAGVAKGLANTIQQNHPLVISIAAGVDIQHLQHWLGDQIAIVRAMPNTPALIGAGATALFANPFVTDSQHKLAESLLRAVGMVVWLDDENLMHVITSLSGSGPAYFFLVIEMLQNAAIELGVPAEIARLLTLQTAVGATRMALESDIDVIELRRRVTSPGGTTERALNVLEENQIRDIFKNALKSATTRSKELTQMLDT